MFSAAIGKSFPDTWIMHVRLRRRRADGPALASSTPRSSGNVGWCAPRSLGGQWKLGMHSQLPMAALRLRDRVKSRPLRPPQTPDSGKGAGRRRTK